MKYKKQDEKKKEGNRKISKGESIYFFYVGTAFLTDEL